MTTMVAILFTSRPSSNCALVPGGKQTSLAAEGRLDGAPVYKLNSIFPQGRLKLSAHDYFKIPLPPCGAVFTAIGGDGPQLIIVKARMDDQDIQSRLQSAQRRKVIFLQVVRRKLEVRLQKII